MKPSERITEIYKELQTLNHIDVIYTSVSAVIQYLDEEYEKSRVATKEGE